MKFKYRAFKKPNDSPSRYGKMPMLQVGLKFGRNVIDLDCLVDSRAGDCLFNYRIGELLGIDFSRCPTREYEGIGGIIVIGYLSTVLFQVKGFGEWFSIDAGFVPDDDIPLLGHAGFFENFEVIIRTYRNQFEVKKPSRE